MFVAQIILCSSIFSHCVGFEDENKYSPDRLSCEKRIEVLIKEADQSLPQFVVARSNCRKIPGHAV